MSLATKYRPQTFSDIQGQDQTVRIIQNQIKQGNFGSVYMFVGKSGSGKTTCAKILAKEIDGEILELDCASHNGVAEIKEIIENAKVPSILKPRKVIVLDECQTLSNAAWSSMLIALEEGIKNVIFIFCTTDPQKIPNTIYGRADVFEFKPLLTSNICSRLKEVCTEENIEITDKVLEIIAESANGSMRQALTNLEKCVMYGEFDEVTVRRLLNHVGDKTCKAVYDAVCKNDRALVIKMIDTLYQRGYDLYAFVRTFLTYCVYKENDMVMLDTILAILDDIRNDDNPKNIIIARLLTYKGGINDEQKQKQEPQEKSHEPLS